MPDASPTPHTDTTSLVCFGKMPTYGDFLRYNAGGGTVRSMEQWFQHGLHNLYARMRQHALNGVYDHAPTLRFIYCPTASPSLLTGALRMSRDETGRRYPFVVATEVDKSRMQPRRASILPFCDASFLDGAAALAEEAARGAVPREALQQRLDALDPISISARHPAASVFDTAEEARLEAYFRQTSFRAFAEHLWDDFEDSRKYLVLRNLLASLEPVRSSVPARFSLGLRFPISSDETAARDVSFWVQLSLRIVNAANVTPTFFWSASPEGGDADSTLLLFFRPPPPRVLTHLLPVRLASDNICELERSGRKNAAEAVLALPDRYGRLLESETVTLWEFLGHF